MAAEPTFGVTINNSAQIFIKKKRLWFKIRRGFTVLFVALADIPRPLNGNTSGIAKRELRNSLKLSNSSSIVCFTCMDFSELFPVITHLRFGPDLAAT